jgi:membrane protein YqaA with SNARE-associated domain
MGISIAIILLIVILSFWLAVNPHWVRHFGRWGYVGAFVISLIASATIILPAPGIAVVIAMSAALDPVALGIVAGLGSAVGELSGYITGASGRAFISEGQRRRFDYLHDLTNRYGAIALAILAALPFPFFDFAGIVAGVVRMNILAFLSAITIGKSIKYIILIFIGVGPLHMLQRMFH